MSCKALKGSELDSAGLCCVTQCPVNFLVPQGMGTLHDMHQIGAIGSAIMACFNKNDSYTSTSLQQDGSRACCSSSVMETVTWQQQLKAVTWCETDVEPDKNVSCGLHL